MKFTNKRRYINKQEYFKRKTELFFKMQTVIWCLVKFNQLVKYPG